MHLSKSLDISGSDDLFDKPRFLKIRTVAAGIALILIIVILVVSLVTLVRVNQSNRTESPINNSTTVPMNPTLTTSIRVVDAMNHLRELQRIATGSSNTRAINTPGFNQTLDYIVTQLTDNTDYVISRSYFSVRDFKLASDPILISSVSDIIKNHTYSTDLSIAEFYYVIYSTSANFSDFIGLTAVPNVGCTDDDWMKADPPPEGRVALVKRGACLSRDKVTLATKYNATAVLMYNEGGAAEFLPPIEVSLAQNNTLPALFLSYPVGRALADAALDPSKNASVKLFIEVENRPNFPVGNICADTPTGDVTQTIVIGSHSDSVPAGPGINDNGSGTAANLVLAATLARLFRTSTYPKYKYRVRFCWWGAEEVGLLGSDYHVQQAKVATVPGERLSDYLVNLDYDMLASPNYFFGIYDGRTARNDTPSHALPGSNKITALYKDWFVSQSLPWDYTDFSGRSDYGPFLAEGIAAGGLFSGADEIKPQAQRDRYDQILGQGMGGISRIVTDPCYHEACDSIQNINVFAYEKMLHAAAYVLEYLAREDDLKTWLYPNGTAHGLDA